MLLTPGTRLGPYEILSPIGAGGMGEVYQARDTRLDRTVAIKVLPPDFAADAERRQRFEREARLIASLSHPHICALYDVGSAPAAGANHPAAAYLVMEYLDGETLASRIARGPIPVDESLRYGRDIALALDAAHRQRIVHRDLKPGNIMLTRSGVKLLDFGLARAIDSAFESDSSASTVEMAALSIPGTVFGTVPYMAPEQVQGRSTDSRSDIFALGAVIHEMLTGRRAFEGESHAAVASAILTSEPPPLTASSSLERIVRTCLAKDPEERWQSAHDVALQLGAVQQRDAAAVPEPAPRRAWIPWAVAGLAAVVAVAASVAAWRAGGGARPDATRLETPVAFTLPPPTDGRFFFDAERLAMAVSPDGSRVAYAAVAGGRRSLWVRPLASSDAKPIAGTDNATSVFWSPDGKSLAFFAGDRLKRVDAGGGTATTICTVREGIGYSGTWGADGNILFASVQGEAIMRVSTSGGAAVEALAPDRERGQRRLAWPSFLPDGLRFLYLAGLADDSGAVMLGSPGGASIEVMRVKSRAQFVEPGFLVFGQDSTLLARRFDPVTGQVAGEPVAIGEGVNSFLSTGVVQFSASPSGVIAFLPHYDESTITSFDHSGRQPTEVRPPGGYQSLRVSPDGTEMLFDRRDDRTTTWDIWQMELARGGETKITSDPGSEVWSVRAPDGSIIYSATRGRAPRLVRRAAGSAVEESLFPEGPEMHISPDVSPDGRTLVFSQRVERGTFSLFTMSLSDRRSMRLHPSVAAGEGTARFSPDGRFIAYVSDESERPEVYVEPFPDAGGRRAISVDGGSLPRWSRDGRELYYLTLTGHMKAVPMTFQPSLRSGTPVTLFDRPTRLRWLDYDVMPDGRFMAIVPSRLAGEQPLTVVVNWPAAVAR